MPKGLNSKLLASFSAVTLCPVNAVKSVISWLKEREFIRQAKYIINKIRCNWQRLMSENAQQCWPTLKIANNVRNTDRNSQRWQCHYCKKQKKLHTINCNTQLHTETIYQKTVNVRLLLHTPLIQLQNAFIDSGKCVSFNSNSRGRAGHGSHGLMQSWTGLGHAGSMLTVHAQSLPGGSMHSVSSIFTSFNAIFCYVSCSRLSFLSCVMYFRAIIWNIHLLLPPFAKSPNQ